MVITFNKNVMRVALLALLVGVITGVVVVANNSGWLPGDKILADVTAKKTLDYINTSLLTDGQKATLNSVNRESGLLKLNLTIDGNTFDSYVTKDGRFLFPNAPLTIGEKAGAVANTDTPTPTTKELTKVDNTMLEAYIVSRCPYGLQMQRMMVDAIANIPSLADHIKVRYMGAITDGKITAMHGDQEAQENLKQICVREEQADKYWNYVGCYMKNGDSTACSTSAGLDTGKINTCMTDPKKGLTYAQADFDLNAKYGVTGSPTLILNGAKVSEFDFGGRSSDAIRTIVCGSSSNPLESCDKTLNTASAAAAFSATYTGTTSSNTAPSASAANCAPATPS